MTQEDTIKRLEQRIIVLEKDLVHTIHAFESIEAKWNATVEEFREYMIRND
jgi:hypothetical protein